MIGQVSESKKRLIIPNGTEAIKTSTRRQMDDLSPMVRVFEDRPVQYRSQGEVSFAGFEAVLRPVGNG
jgi:hypothetical protein